jgi:long-chain acyl-CoA synthetase
MSFIEALFQNLENNPAKPFVTEVQGKNLVSATGKALLDRIANARGLIRAREVKPGDHVVLLGPNRIDWVAADLALLAEGAVVVPMYDRQDPRELVAMMGDCKPVMVLVADDELAASIREHWAEAPIATWKQAFQHTPFEGARTPRKTDDPVTIIYTSGTSGEPKGVVNTRGNVDYMLPITGSSLSKMMSSTTGDDRVFHYLPLCFSGSRIVLWTCLFRSNGIMLSTDIDNLVEEMGTAAPNYFLNVPMLLERIKNGVETKLRERGATISFLYDRAREASERQVIGEAGTRDRMWLALATKVLFGPVRLKIGKNLSCLICGSAPLGEDTQRWFEMLGIPVYQVYGLTETTAIVTMDQPPAVKPGRVGPAIDGVEMKLSDDNEILVKSPGIFSQYLNKPEQTKAAFDDGWFRTGDIAEVDDDGYWRIVGRSKNLLVPSSGHNIAPEPLEQKVIETIEGVEQAVVVGHAKPYLGAIISGDVPQNQIDEGLRRINADLPHYRRIRKFIVAEQPFTIENGLLTANRKLRRQAIEQAFALQVEEMYR